MAKAQEYPVILASRTIAKAIKDGDVQSARRMKQSRDKRYRPEAAKISMERVEGIEITLPGKTNEDGEA